MSEYIHNSEANIAEKNGDVVPTDDLMTSDTEWSDVQNIENQSDALRAAERIVDIETARDFGPIYAKEVARIEQCIQESRQGGYAELKVVDDNGVRFGLAEYITRLSLKINTKELTLDGFEAIRQKYIGEPAVPPLQSETPPSLSVYESGAYTYNDFQSAAAGDKRELDR